MTYFTPSHLYLYDTPIIYLFLIAKKTYFFVFAKPQTLQKALKLHKTGINSSAYKNTVWVSAIEIIQVSFQRDQFEVVFFLSNKVFEWMLNEKMSISFYSSPVNA